MVLLLQWDRDRSGMGNQELSFKYVKYTIDTRTYVKVSVGSYSVLDLWEEVKAEKSDKNHQAIGDI